MIYFLSSSGIDSLFLQDFLFHPFLLHFFSRGDHHLPSILSSNLVRDVGISL